MQGKHRGGAQVIRVRATSANQHTHALIAVTSQHVPEQKIPIKAPVIDGFPNITNVFGTTRHPPLACNALHALKHLLEVLHSSKLVHAGVGTRMVQPINQMALSFVAEKVSGLRPLSRCWDRQASTGLRR